MNKSKFQLIFSVYVFACFVFGLYSLGFFLYPMLGFMLGGKILSSYQLVGFLTVVVFAGALLSLLLAASVQIFLTGRWNIFRYLLYASIPVINLFNHVVYTFYFMPYLYAILGYTSAGTELSLNLDFEAYPLLFGFTFAFSQTKGDLLEIGINVVPIIVLILLKRFYQKD